MGTADAEKRSEESASATGEVKSWLDAFEEVVASMERREEVVECTFEDVEVDVPVRTGADAPTANWRLDGTVRVHVEEWTRPLVQWLRWWRRQTPERRRTPEKGGPPGRK
ncbi:hypothetical protein [Halegenticoccus tardaugens]|uniref:hypothetical protein n=1 Tax=Halegenticoccus tardaugens TaxID=2071624 RepID=UPI00100B88CF|nr:hypothetical protein [Halegenticoccus tardaugens]